MVTYVFIVDSTVSTEGSVVHGIRLVTSPGDGYQRELLGTLESASRFTLITAFATSAGIEIVRPAIEKVLARENGRGRIIVAIDRGRFNTARTFETLLALKAGAGKRLSIGVALQDRDRHLLHAKALFTEGPAGRQLLIGSANLTSGALGGNFELGALIQNVDGDLQNLFERFVQRIEARSLDDTNARDVLIAMGWLAPRPAPSPPSPPRPPGPSLSAIFANLAHIAPSEEAEPELHVAQWIQDGFIVGRGRRSLDVLVLRVPQDQLIDLGFLQRSKKRALGTSSYETQAMGYGVELLPTERAERVRNQARRVAQLLGKLTIQLPCFGYWMPASYWKAFEEARESLQTQDRITPPQVRAEAAAHREALLAGGLEREVDSILDALASQKILVEGKRSALREWLLDRFRKELALRTPDVVVSALGFRTARQRWSPFDSFERSTRQLMTDVIQASFANTYRTGDWPRRFRSHAARRIVGAVAERVLAGGGQTDGERANEITERAAEWDRDGEAVPFREVVTEFRKLVPDELDFQAPPADDLVGCGEAFEGDEDAI